MTRKHWAGTSPAGPKREVDSIEIVTALREGRLTRGMFDAWHSRRRRSETGFVVTLREKKPAPAKRSPRRHQAR